MIVEGADGVFDAETVVLADDLAKPDGLSELGRRVEGGFGKVFVEAGV